MDTKDLIRKYKWPKNSTIVPKSNTDLIDYQEYAEMSRAGEDVINKLPVLKNAEHIVMFPNGTLISIDSDGRILKSTAKRTKLMFCEMGERGLVTKEYVPLKAGKPNPPKPVLNTKSKEEILETYRKEKQKAEEINHAQHNKKIIEDMMKRSKEEKHMALGSNLKEGVKGIQMPSVGGNTAKMNVTGGGATPVAPSRGNGKVAEKEDVAETAVAEHRQMLGEFNRKHGSLDVIVTRNDSKTSFSAVTVKEKSPEKATAGAGGDTVNAGQSDNDKSAKNKTEAKELKLKDSKPSPIAGGILTMPEGGIFSLDAAIKGEYTNKDGNVEKVAPIADKTGKVTYLLPKDELITSIVVLFNKVIEGNPETFGVDEHGSNYKFVGCITNSKSNSKKEQAKGVEPKTTFRYKLVAPKGAQLIKPGAYFPLRMYEKLDPSAGNEDLINYSAFVHLFNKTAKKDPAHGKLKVEHQMLVSQELGTKVKLGDVEVDKITSSFFAHNTFNNNGLTCGQWDKPKVTLDANEVRIPAKYPSIPKSDATKTTAKLRVYDATRIEDEANSSLNAPEFASLVERFGEFLNAKTLSEVLAASKSHKSNSAKKRDNETELLIGDVLKTGELNLSAMKDLTLLNQNKVRLSTLPESGVRA